MRRLKVAVLGSNSLIGKELREILAERNFPLNSLTLLDEEEVPEAITELEKEANFALGINEESFADVELVFICGKEEDTARYLPWLKKSGVIALDLSHYLRPKEGFPLAISGVNEERIKKQKLIALPHPLAIIIASLLKPIVDRYHLREAVITAFQPASVYGPQGLEELYQQTVRILNFAELPKKIFGRQLAFNIFPAVPKEEGIEEEILEEIGIALKSELPISLKLIQVPVFHSFALSLFLILEKAPSLPELKKALSHLPSIKLAKGREKPSGPVEAGGKNEIIVGEIKKDKRNNSAYWIWASADNLRRGSALNAVEIAELFLSED